MKYIKKLLSVLKWLIIFMVGELLVILLFTFLYNITNKEVNLNTFINNNSILIIIVTTLILLPIFYKSYKQYIKESNFNIKDIYVPVLLGACISLIYNITLFNLNNIITFTDKFNPTNLSVITQIICSGILGPVLEEMLFRGIVYNKLKEFNKPITSIILCSLLFSVIHSTIIDMIYAFIISFILIYLYEKYKTIKAPILAHISCNITIILMFNLIIENNLILNYSLLVISILLLLIILKKFIKKDV